MSIVAALKVGKKIYLAADTKITTDANINYAYSKLIELGDGTKIGLAGTVSLIERFKDLCKYVDNFTELKGSVFPHLREALDGSKDDDYEISALIVSEGKLLELDSSLCLLEVDHYFHAVGSGSDYVFGALEMAKDEGYGKATLLDAIEIAKKYDPGCGGDTEIIEV